MKGLAEIYSYWRYLPVIEEFNGRLSPYPVQGCVIFFGGVSTMTVAIDAGNIRKQKHPRLELIRAGICRICHLRV
jgi:hypothetical protein